MIRQPGARSGATSPAPAAPARNTSTATGRSDRAQRASRSVVRKTQRGVCRGRESARCRLAFRADFVVRAIAWILKRRRAVRIRSLPDLFGQRLPPFACRRSRREHGLDPLIALLRDRLAVDRAIDDQRLAKEEIANDRRAFGEAHDMRQEKIVAKPGRMGGGIADRDRMHIDGGYLRCDLQQIARSGEMRRMKAADDTAVTRRSFRKKRDPAASRACARAMAALASRIDLRLSRSTKIVRCSRAKVPMIGQSRLRAWQETKSNGAYRAQEHRSRKHDWRRAIAAAFSARSSGVPPCTTTLICKRRREAYD